MSGYLEQLKEAERRFDEAAQEPGWWLLRYQRPTGLTVKKLGRENLRPFGWDAR